METTKDTPMVPCIEKKLEEAMFLVQDLSRTAVQIVEFLDIFRVPKSAPEECLSDSPENGWLFKIDKMLSILLSRLTETQQIQGEIQHVLRTEETCGKGC